MDRYSRTQYVRLLGEPKTVFANPFCPAAAATRNPFRCEYNARSRMGCRCERASVSCPWSYVDRVSLLFTDADCVLCVCSCLCIYYMPIQRRRRFLHRALYVLLLVVCGSTTLFRICPINNTRGSALPLRFAIASAFALAIRVFIHDDHYY